MRAISDFPLTTVMIELCKPTVIHLIFKGYYLITLTTALPIHILSV